jgi:hypothetical protein
MKTRLSVAVVMLPTYSSCCYCPPNWGHRRLLYFPAEYLLNILSVRPYTYPRKNSKTAERIFTKFDTEILYFFHRAFSLSIQLTNKCTNINYFIVFINIDAFPYTCFGRWSTDRNTYREFMDITKNYKVVYVCAFVGYWIIIDTESFWLYCWNI